MNYSKLTYKQKYKMLKYLYENNHLYENLKNAGLYEVEQERMIHGLRNPTNRSVEFFTSKIIPGDLSNVTITSDNKAIIQPIQEIWKRSNFAANKQQYTRDLALTGDLFLKAVTDGQKVWFEEIPAEYVTMFEEDSRQFLTKIRIDVPVIDEETENALTHTEYWSKPEGYFSIWVHDKGEETPLDQLGDPMNYGTLAEAGIDFVPFTHTKFRAVSWDERGVSCVWNAIDKIQDADQLASWLERIAFRNGKAYWIAKRVPDSEKRLKNAPKLDELAKTVFSKIKRAQ